MVRGDMRRRASRTVVALASAVAIVLGAGAARAAGAGADSLETPPPGVRRWQTGIVRSDRLEHMSLSLGIGVGIGILSRSPAAGSGAALGLGLAKEITDDRFDRVDLAADAIGAGLAALLVAALKR